MKILILIAIMFSTTLTMAQTFQADTIYLFRYNENGTEIEDYSIDVAKIEINIDIIRMLITYTDHTDGFTKEFEIVDVSEVSNEDDDIIYYIQNPNIYFGVSSDIVVMIYPSEQDDGTTKQCAMKIMNK